MSLRDRTAKFLGVTNITGLLLAYFVGNSFDIEVFLLFYKEICLKEREVWRIRETKSLSSLLSHKVCRRLFAYKSLIFTVI